MSGHRRVEKEEQGMILLVQHPDWTDEQICQAVKTTDKQMKRWGRFHAARASTEALQESNPRVVLGRCPAAFSTHCR